MVMLPLERDLKKKSEFAAAEREVRLSHLICCFLACREKRGFLASLFGGGRKDNKLRRVHHEEEKKKKKKKTTDDDDWDTGALYDQAS